MQRAAHPQDATPPPFLKAHREGVLLAVHLQPRAKRDAIIGEHDGRLKIAVTSPPVEGRANEALIRLLAAELHCPKAAIEIVGGSTARRKDVLLHGVDPAVARERLGR